MRRSYLVGLVLIATCAAFSLSAWGSQPAKKAAPVPAVLWEYKSFQHPIYTGHGLDKAMNDLGEQGWEYCGAHQATVTQDDIPRPVSVYVFKRAKVVGGK